MVNMKRREFIALLGGAAAVWPLAAYAQQAARLLQITVWMARANDAEGLRHAAALREGLQALGWTNGHNVRIDYRWVTGDIDRVSLAKEIVEQQPDVILVESAVATLSAFRCCRALNVVRQFWCDRQISGTWLRGDKWDTPRWSFRQPICASIQTHHMTSDRLSTRHVIAIGQAPSRHLPSCVGKRLKAFVRMV
jgi:hypothetical protein